MKHWVYRYALATTRSTVIVLRAGLRAYECPSEAIILMIAKGIRFSYLPMLLHTVVVKTELDSLTVAGAASELFYV